MQQYLTRKWLIAALLCLGLQAQTTQAEVGDLRWYDVEVILFSQHNEDYRHSENWPIDYNLPDMENARELLIQDKRRRNPQQPTAFRLLDAEELGLNDAAERIEKAPDMDLLGHFGWRQPGLPAQNAIAVRIDSSLFERTRDLMPVVEGGSGNERGASIEGTLKLILSRYLHIQTDLLYREPVAEITGDSNILLLSDSAASNPQGASEQDLFALAAENGEAKSPYRVYVMKQSRRMRSNELHYLDQPVFGMAIRVKPYQPEAAAAPQE